MKRSSPQKNPHRIDLSRPTDLCAVHSAPDQCGSDRSIPVGDSTPLSEHSHNEGCPRPFGDYALALCQRGLAVVPCGGDDGKTPLIKGWHKSKRSAATITKLALRYPDANIGIVCGLSGVGIVDVDDPTQVSAMLARFGDTPLITRTPSGGCHLWYAAPDVVRSTNLRSEDLAVDIKADGGLVIVPPSFNRQTGKPYVFEPGSWDDLGRLPLFRVEALGQSKTSPKSSRSAKPATAGGAIGQGMRDDAVFHRAMLEAPHVKSVDELIAAMQSFNETHCWPPLPARQVEEKARSARGYEVRGDNWIGHGQGGVVVNAAVGDDLLNRPHGEDALAPLYKLKRSHGALQTLRHLCESYGARSGDCRAGTPPLHSRTNDALSAECARAGLASRSRCARSPGAREVRVNQSGWCKKCTQYN